MLGTIENTPLSKSSSYIAIGILLLFTVNMLYAIKDVVAGNLLSNDTSVMSIMFVVFLIAVVSFTLVDLFQTRWRASTAGTATKKQQVRFINFVLLNIATACSWWGYFYSLKFIEPAVAGAFIGGLVISFAWALNLVFRKRAPSSQNDFWTTLAVFMLGGLLMYLSLDGQSAVGTNMTQSEAVHGFFGALVCAVGISVTTIHLKRLFDDGASSARLLSRRFYLVVVISGTFAIQNGDLFSIVWFDLAVIASISIFCIVIALYALQEGIRRCEPVLVESIHAALPVFTLFFQLFDPRLQASFSSWLCIGLITLIAIQNCHHHITRET